jgi:protein-disulfide isomerase
MEEGVAKQAANTNQSKILGAGKPAPDFELRSSADKSLDLTRFARELADERYATKVRNDFRGGVRSGVNGTPTFFINGVRFDGDWRDPTTFAAVLMQAERMDAPA